jgi:hypothetical protein
MSSICRNIANILPRSYNGYYTGLSIRLQEFDSPTRRQRIFAVTSPVTIGDIVRYPPTTVKVLCKRCCELVRLSCDPYRLIKIVAQLNPDMWGPAAKMPIPGCKCCRGHEGFASLKERFDPVTVHQVL